MVRSTRRKEQIFPVPRNQKNCACPLNSIKLQLASILEMLPKKLHIFLAFLCTFSVASPIRLTPQNIDRSGGAAQAQRISFRTVLLVPCARPVTQGAGIQRGFPGFKNDTFFSMPSGYVTDATGAPRPVSRNAPVGCIRWSQSRLSAHAGSGCGDRPDTCIQPRNLA